MRCFDIRNAKTRRTAANKEKGCRGMRLTAERGGFLFTYRYQHGFAGQLLDVQFH